MYYCSQCSASPQRRRLFPFRSATALLISKCGTGLIIYMLLPTSGIFISTWFGNICEISLRMLPTAWPEDPQRSRLLLHRVPGRSPFCLFLVVCPRTPTPAGPADWARFAFSLSCATRAPTPAGPADWARFTSSLSCATRAPTPAGPANWARFGSSLSRHLGHGHLQDGLRLAPAVPHQRLKVLTGLTASLLSIPEVRGIGYC